MGTVTCFTISFNAVVEDWSGQDTLTISAPASASELTCSIVFLVSVVIVFVIDCTDTGRPPPTGIFPT